MTTTASREDQGQVIDARPVLLVAGPTASGKSGLAMALAAEFGGVIINADSMQIYEDLRIVTARPTVEDEQATPHRLYGCMPASRAFSVGDWLGLASQVIEETLAAGKLPVVAGGTGLYLKALVEGIAPVPAVPDAVRARVQTHYDEAGGRAVRERLRAVDPVTAERLVDADRQRLTRALEVFEATGRPLSAWIGDGNAPVLRNVRYATMVIEPPRDALYTAIDRRFDAMVENGALDEVGGFLKQGLDPLLPAMKAVGVRELGGYLDGSWDLATGVAKAQKASRNYAKRQLTWFRNQIQKDYVINAQYSESDMDNIFAFVRQNGLTA